MSIERIEKSPRVALDAARPDGTRVVEGPDAADWNRYVEQSESGTVWHRAEWEGLFGFYRLPVVRLAAVRGQSIVGVLPLVWQRSMAFGSHFVSLPWFDSAGVLADDPEARGALVDHALRLVEKRHAKTVQLRQLEPLDLSPHVRTDKVLMRLALDPDPESLWKGFKPEVRNQIRRARKAGLSVDRGGRELVADFFDVYSRNMRDLGSPSHHRRFFETLVDTFTDRTRIHVVRLEGKAIGAGMTIANGKYLEIPWASSLREFNKLCVNHMMYWEILEEACRDGYEWFHFGRSTPGSGPHKYKRQWGAKDVQLYWYYLSPSESDAQAAAVAPRESYGRAAETWKRLPLWMARSLGPRIIAKVP